MRASETMSGDMSLARFRCLPWSGAVDLTWPLLLLDLDGVLNPFATATCPDGSGERVLFEGEDPVRFCFQHGDWIRELARVGDLSWATGWGATANEVYLPLLGLEPLPFLQFPPIPFDPEAQGSGHRRGGGRSSSCLDR
jgi:hypothetical protein